MRRRTACVRATILGCLCVSVFSVFPFYEASAQTTQTMLREVPVLTLRQRNERRWQQFQRQTGHRVISSFTFTAMTALGGAVITGFDFGVVGFLLGISNNRPEWGLRGLVVGVISGGAVGAMLGTPLTEPGVGTDLYNIPLVMTGVLGTTATLAIYGFFLGETAPERQRALLIAGGVTYGITLLSIPVARIIAIELDGARQTRAASVRRVMIPSPSLGGFGFGALGTF